MLKHFVFVVIVLSASVTWIIVFLFEKSKCLATGSGDQRGKKDDNDKENYEDKGTTVVMDGAEIIGLYNVKSILTDNSI